MTPYGFGIKHDELHRYPDSVYVMRDPRDGDVRYVGVARDLSARLCCHMGPLKGKRAPVVLWLAELKALGLRPVMERIAAFWDNDEARDFEGHVIRSLVPYGRLTNVRTNGSREGEELRRSR